MLLNDPQFVESCRVLASRVIGEASGFDERLDAITLRLVNRPFEAQERAIEELEADLARFTD